MLSQFQDLGARRVLRYLKKPVVMFRPVLAVELVWVARETLMPEWTSPRQVTPYSKMLTYSVGYLDASSCSHVTENILSYCPWKADRMNTYRFLWCRFASPQQTGTFPAGWGTKKGRSIWLHHTRLQHRHWQGTSQTHESSCSRERRYQICRNLHVFWWFC